MSDHPLEPIFNPRSVALVGVSSRPSAGLSGGFIQAMLSSRFPDDRIYPVNPKAEEVAGLRCYPSVLEAPDPVDHVISMVPAGAAPGLADQCIEKGVRSVHFFTAGFSETGSEEMAAVEREMVAKLVAAGIRVIGPNCLGLHVPDNGVAFGPELSMEPGNVFLLSQSGWNSREIARELQPRGVLFSKIISYGNGADLRAHDFLDYAASDPKSEIVVAYIEGVQDGRLFFDALKRCAAAKPTIVLKGGSTGAGARAAHSHTGALAGSGEVFEAMCRQTGALHARDLADLTDLVVAVSSSVRTVRGRGVVLVSIGGGFVVLASDAIAAEGLEMPPMPQSVRSALHEFVPVAGTSVNNPIDATAVGEENNERMLRLVAEAEGIDAVFTSPMMGMGGRGAGPSPHGTGGLGAGGSPSREDMARMVSAGAAAFAGLIARLQEETGTIFVGVGRENSRMAAMMSDDPASSGRAFQQAATERGLGVFPTVDRAARAMSAMIEWRERREGLPPLS